MSTTTLRTIYPVIETESRRPAREETSTAAVQSPLWSDRESVVRTSEHLLYRVLSIGYLIVVAWFVFLFVTSR